MDAEGLKLYEAPEADAQQVEQAAEVAEVTAAIEQAITEVEQEAKLQVPTKEEFEAMDMAA